jgi:hypothetical protein
MNEKKCLRLINQELDGANSAEESRMLKDYLAAHEEARARFAELGTAMDLLKRSETPVPGPDFGKAVMAEISRQRAQGAQEGVRKGARVRPNEGPWRRVASMWGPMKLKYALFFALGLSMGLVLLFFFKSRPVGPGLDARQIVGTVVDSAALRPAGSLKWEQDGMSQDVSFSAGEGVFYAAIRGRAADPIEIVLSFDIERLEFTGWRRLEGERGELKIQPGRLELQTSGDHDYVLSFKVRGGLPPSVDYKVFASGFLVYGQAVSLSSGGRP